MSEPLPETGRPLPRLLRYATPHRGRVLLAAACTVLNKLADIAPEALIGVAVDVVVRQEDSFVAALGLPDPRHQLLALASVTLLVWVAESAFQYAYEVLWRGLSQALEHELRRDAWRHVAALDLRFFEEQTTGGLLAVLSDDVNQLERFLDRGAAEILHVVTTVVVIGAVFLYLAPGVALLAMLPMPMIAAFSVWFQGRLEPRYAAVRARVATLSARLATSLGGLVTIKAYTAEDHEAARLAAESAAYRDANLHAIRLSAAFVPLIRMGVLAGFTGTLVLGGMQTLDGQLAVATFSVLVFMTQRLLWPLTRLGETLDLYQRAMASTRRIFALLDTPLPPVTGDTPLPRAQARGEVAFEDVSFAYPGRALVLRGVSLTLPAGKTVAIVGTTGSGKSTLLRLLLRFQEPDAGRVTLDGHPLASLRLSDLRGAIGLVSQDPFLFHGTIRENIAYGTPDATPDRVEAAARAAEAHAFIAALPDSYDTVVGERGQLLSGGQRQRVALARAILRDPAILVLDEATSAVDNETEVAIQRSLERVTHERSTLVVAHRLSTVRGAHRIHVLEAGEIVEAGTHDELVAQDGVYAAMWRVQTGERAA